MSSSPGQRLDSQSPGPSEEVENPGSNDSVPTVQRVKNRFAHAFGCWTNFVEMVPVICWSTQRLISVLATRWHTGAQTASIGGTSSCRKMSATDVAIRRLGPETSRKQSDVRVPPHHGDCRPTFNSHLGGDREAVTLV